MDAKESDKNGSKTEKRNRNEENRRQIVGFIADNGISDLKTVSKAIGLKPSRTRDYLKQIVDEGILEVEGSIKVGSIKLNDAAKNFHLHRKFAAKIVLSMCTI